MARTTVEGIFNTGPQVGFSSLSDGQRLAEGGPLPHLSRELHAAHYEYIDDFGIMGLGFPTQPGQEAATTVEEIWFGAEELVVSAGFKVHKDACSVGARVIGGDFPGTRLAPSQGKKWLAVFGTREILIHKWELPDTVARIVGILSWGFLICRGALSVFAEVHSWCMEFRGGPRREVPREVLWELAAAAPLAPLISVDLSTPWGPTVMMLGASLYGGALMSTVATVEEQRREARYAVRGGWTVWTGISPSWAADAWCEGEAFRRVGADVELGTRIRVPPAHECWGDIARWKEVVRWRWDEKEHINLLEMRTGVAAARRSARTRASWGKRHLRITDSMVCLGGFSKGRSASRPILILCRRTAALDLGRGMREYWRRVPSDRNHSDGPSRGFPIGQAPKERGADELALPETVASRIEALADLAAVDPFQPLRMGVSIPVKVLRFVHLCSGYARIGDLEDWLLRIAGSRGYLTICTNVDIGFGSEFDLVDEVNVRGLELLAEALHALPGRGFASSLEAPLRYVCDISCGKVKLGNAQLLSSLRILKPIGLEGGSVSVEHPADPGCPPFPSIFVTKELMDWGAQLGAYRVTFPQCMRGCPALKLTTPTACSSDFCRMLAERHVDATLTMQERREADLTERAVEQLISETLERRRRDATLLDEGPCAMGRPPPMPDDVRAQALQDYADMMQDLRDWAQQWYSDLTQRATDGTEWQEWRVAFMTDVLLSGSNEALRLRHHAQHRKMGNTHRRNDAEGSHLQQAQRRERATHGLALLPFSVSTKTALGCYVPNVRRFLDFALEVNLPMMSRGEIDDSILCYLDRLVEDEEVGPRRGDFVVHGLAYEWPELSTGLPRSNRALRAWHRLHVAGEGGPQPLELWAVLDEAVRLAESVEAADAAEVAMDAYLRSADLIALQAADIVVDVGEAGEQIVALRLGATERGERTDTGARQGVLIDRRHVSDVLVRRKSERGPSDRVFSCSVDACRQALRRACDDVGVEQFPPRAARLPGPSHDAATGCRAAWAIQRRGRWASEKSVLGRTKTRALVAARAALPPDILERGGRLMQ
ncbi:unnamed protein product, partial [Prorocentrum cordatum]